ncbi:hypothetical protein [Lutibaculum baratangense]|uniref:Lipoprotein n=1 Tax=Lutibaculum baratangense AMV1 TaxID=631454 RepID=V4T9Z1_9HYPH|nr:hypothetical protein [Lutibaculum baratangense]ESR23308.1 hypothetical protein N177_3376 [Lutibaculum baratangense AMV1]
MTRGRSKRGSAGRARRVGIAAAVVAVAGLAVAACGQLPDPKRFAPVTPANVLVSQDVDYPNINNAPDRPSKLKAPEEQRALEEELRRRGANHVRSTQRVIETTNRRQ